MSEKSSSIFIRVEPDVKEKAESILKALGITPSAAINMFYKQIILNNGLPFEPKLPPNMVDVSKISKKELNEELMKGYNQIQNGETMPFDEAVKKLYDEL
ncbi:MAG: type II toxin-antitoxin system RelB/DinJ family antitoxin, partial [Coprobacillus sp.]|nr:type II toxin-antitoxin system RelB/DinJ family antitoxin [Coprobacillus sp.]